MKRSQGRLRRAGICKPLSRLGRETPKRRISPRVGTLLCSTASNVSRRNAVSLNRDNSLRLARFNNDGVCRVQIANAQLCNLVQAS